MNNEGGEQDGVANRAPTALTFWQSYVTLFDFQGPAVQEAWYGHHSNWLRILFFLSISSVCYALNISSSLAYTVTLLGAKPDPQHVVPHLETVTPFFRVLGTASLHKLKESHKSCVRAIREIFEDEIDFDCVIDEEYDGADRGSSFIDFDAYDGPDSVPWPRACNFEEMGWGEGTGDNKQSMFLRIERNKRTRNLINSAFVVVYADCTFHVVPPLIQHVRGKLDFTEPAKNIMINAHGFQPRLGSKQMHNGEQLLVVQSVMSQWLSMLSNNFPFSVEALHARLLDYRHVIVILLEMVVYTSISVFSLVVTMMKLLAVTVLWRLLLPWPQGLVGMQKASFGSVWSTLVLISTVTIGYTLWDGFFVKDSCFFPYLFDVIVIQAARGTGADIGSRVQREIIFFYIARLFSYSALDILGFLVQVPVLGGVLSLILPLVPGNKDADKLLVLYAWYLSFPRMLQGAVIAEEPAIDPRPPSPQPTSGDDANIDAGHEKVE